MIKCPNCSGNLKFHIPSQKMNCEHCGSQFDPYDFDGVDKKVRETEIPDVESFVVDDRIYTYNTTVFICPECGGEMLGTDTDATGFCSFCGAPVIFNSRISEEKRPKYIIPFKITKEECKSAYEKRLKRALYAPAALKKPEYIDSFRGIYVPHWFYNLEQRGEVSVKGEKRDKRGGNTYIKYYNIVGSVNATYKGIIYDASATFSDDICENIMPYQMKGLKKFTPGFLSGFYADTTDVDDRVYESNAINDAREMSVNMIKNELEYYKDYDRTSEIKFTINDNERPDGCIRVENVDVAMFPVWFMSYRNKDRVAYAAVNGQSGKIVADIPIDYKKYTLGTLLFTIPIFILLNMFFVIKPDNLLAVISVISIIIFILLGIQNKKVHIKENYLDDKGVLARINKAAKLNDEDNEKNSTGKSVAIALGVIIIAFLGGIFAGNIYSLYKKIVGFSPLFIPSAILLVIEVIVTLFWLHRFTKYRVKPSAYRGILYFVIAFAVNSGVLLWYPVSDIYYYGAAIISLAAVFLSVVNIVKYYNKLATRKIPQFDKKGGDDNAV